MNLFGSAIPASPFVKWFEQFQLPCPRCGTDGLVYFEPDEPPLIKRIPRPPVLMCLNCAWFDTPVAIQLTVGSSYIRIECVHSTLAYVWSDDKEDTEKVGIAHTTTVSYTATFDSAHMLPKHPGKCKNLHGHTYRLKVEVRGKVDPYTGMLIDYGDLKQIIDTLVAGVDHKYLNDVYPGMDTTTENLALMFLELLRQVDERIFRVTLAETPKTECVVEATDARS